MPSLSGTQALVPVNVAKGVTFFIKNMIGRRRMVQRKLPCGSDHFWFRRLPLVSFFRSEADQSSDPRETKTLLTYPELARDKRRTKGMRLRPSSPLVLPQASGDIVGVLAKRLDSMK
jgi:hypothetical protein